jgi:hypothetical protein
MNIAASPAPQNSSDHCQCVCLLLNTMMVDHDDFDTQPAGQTNRRLRIDPVVDR